jgi:regulator of protease activity HflC (stomatin/prohibitin superfamily)
MDWQKLLREKMTRNVILGFLVVCLWLGFNSAAPDAGHEVVVIRKPLIFGHGGVGEKSVTAGRSYFAFTTQTVDVNMQPMQFALHFEDLMSKDGVPLDFDSVIRLQITDAVKLVRDFGPNWYDNNVKAEFMNRVRQAVRKHGMNETAISTKAIEEIDDEVTASMADYIKQSGLPMKLIQVTVGKANPPDSVKHQRIDTAVQEQRQLTERQRKLAEDQRKEAEASRAVADNAYRQAMGLSPDLFIQLEAINMQKEVCAKSGCTFVAPGVGTIVGAKH